MKQKFHCGVKIKKVRLLEGLNQFELGEKIGRTQSLISYIEKTGKVNKNILAEIAKVLRVNIEDLVFEDEENAQKHFFENLTKDELYGQMKSEIAFLRKTIEDLKEVIKSFSK